jgi:hypothetical protein
MDAFLEAYYGAGWENIRHFIDFIVDLSNEKNACYGIHGSPEDMYGDHAFAPYNEQLIEWWDNAEAMAETELQLNHVRQSRICCDYLRIGAVHTEKMASGNYADIRDMRQGVKDLYNDCKEFGITRIAENCPLPSMIDYTKNPRTWWSLHYYED